MLKIGLIGCGFMGGTHAACYQALSSNGVQITAVADIRAEKAEEIAKLTGAKIYSTGEELINNADVDAVDICLPTYLHAKHAVLAMEKGKNVFIEKPVCMNMDDAKLLLETKARTGREVMIGQVIRTWEEYICLKQIIDSKVYGEIKSAVFKRLSPLPTWAWDNWLHKPECSGSMALDLHIHDVDFMRYILGEPNNVDSKVVRNNDGVISHIFSFFEYDNASVSIEGGWDYPQDFPFSMEYRVKFEKATMVFNSVNQEPIIYLEGGGQITPKINNEMQSGNNAGGNISSLGGYYNELKYFTTQLINNKPIEIAPLSEAIKSVDLVLKEIELAGGVKI